MLGVGGVCTLWRVVEGCMLTTVSFWHLFPTLSVPPSNRAPSHASSKTPDPDFIP